MDTRPDLADDLVDAPSTDDGADVPPITPVPRDRSPVPRGRRIEAFAPWFFAIAAVVGVERVAMVLATSEAMGTSVQLAAFGVFVGMVLLVMTVGGWLFAKNFR